ncbi:glycosyltransferase family 4 protein [Desulfuromonas sp. KJ2020]|uniref:glycosyltransferase family 4 protein n=1 Tax=Desulfuromonas sp. KJ2020 TaxID=2919173 RepID=UPI0020A75C34|nr:glycosyltransferase family 4 protein [Desulfuromonas sp. KJ2020]MCP3177488.1 glycosyltransferase family 4 protein [Desulfuromonas sp. KJ2020]
MQQKKLIYILNSYSPNDSSHFHHVLGLLDSLAKRGVEIALVIEKADAIPTFSHPNIRVIALQNRQGLLRFAELFRVIIRLIQQGFDRTYIRIAAPAALVATLAHRIYGGAVFFWQSGTTIEYDAAQPISLKKIKWYLSTYLPNTLARRFVHYFVTGPEFMVDYYSRVGGVNKEKIRLLYNDIDVGRFAPPADRSNQKAAFLAAHGFEPGTLVLLLVHRLSPVRRTQLYFPSCLKSLRDGGLLDRVAVIIAGTGPELPAIQAEVQSLDVANRCIFLGSVPNREIQHLYAVADIFLHPTYNEGFPRVVIEAMAAGLPIVSTDAGGTRELMGNLQSSLIVSRDDPEAFARCLAGMIADPLLRQRTSDENQMYVERFSTENVAAMYDEVLFA